MTWSVSGTSSNSHPVAVLSGCTNIPRAGGAQVGETNLILGFSSQPWNRFVHLDPPRGLIRPRGDDRIRAAPWAQTFIVAPSITTPAVT